MDMSGNCILITGGGSGIGRELARRFADLGNEVIVAGRTAETLRETIEGRKGMHFLVFDVQDARDIERLAKEAVARFPAINILFNNAGIMRHEDLTHPADLHDAEASIATNLLGPIRMTNAFIEHLTQQPKATIVNVTSGLAFVPLPITPTYSATKAALHSWTLSLRQQLRGKIEVIELAPPAVQTELTPGQSTRAGYLPLDAFIDEVMALFAQPETPPEILVHQVGFLRWAEREGRFEEALAALSAH